jgi:hypothetical protein
MEIYIRFPIIAVHPVFVHQVHMFTYIFSAPGMAHCQDVAMGREVACKEAAARRAAA